MAKLIGLGNMGRIYPIPAPVLRTSRKAVSTHTGVEKIEKILIANRGEIACRVMRTARKMGIQSVAVYTKADTKSMHVAMSDEAYLIDPLSDEAPKRSSYLDINKIIDVAKKTGAQAIHPGYGFLSENEIFAERCDQEGIEFIGPPSSAIRDMGIKSTSKAIMSAAGVPIIEGYHGEDQSLETLKQEAQRIGYPVMIKAVKGGGGKGMRLADSPEEFEDQLNAAKSEAKSAFADEIVLVEKFVSSPRHVEVQVFGDKHGNYVYLFERDCSVQRRHQKIIEEAPAPNITEETRRTIGEAAVRAAQAVNYVGAGTVEFIMDQDENFYFMEMNTRLQVEHPVTEMITKTDLVEWQIKVADGMPLPQNQSELTWSGHSFEARIYAEDPDNNFMPGAGTIAHLSTPTPDSSTRIETGVRQGDEVSVHYDPMIAKLVVWSDNRKSALKKLQSCLRQYKVAGIRTNTMFLDDLAGHPSFVDGDVHTGFIEQHKDSLFYNRTLPPETICQAALAVMLTEQNQARMATEYSKDSYSPFSFEHGLRINNQMKRKLVMKDARKVKEDIKKDARKVKEDSLGIEVDMTYEVDGSLTVQHDNEQYIVKGSLLNTDDQSTFTCYINGEKSSASFIRNGDTLHLFTMDGAYLIEQPPPRFVRKLSNLQISDSTVTPMPCTIKKLFVTEGDSVTKGQPIVVVEAMKQDHTLTAHVDGIVQKVLYTEGATDIPKGKQLVEIKATETATEED